MPVSSLLQALRQSGTGILYSSELVPPQLRIDVEPAGATLLAQAVAALTAHGLKIQSVATNQFIVVPAPANQFAQGAPPETPVTRRAQATAVSALDEFAVYASRYAIEARDNGAVDSLSHNQIERVPGAKDDALRATQSLPGIANDDGHRPFVRGSLRDDVLVVFDHVALADPFHLNSFQRLMSAFDSSVIDQLDVYSGGFPVRFGTRSGGVMDLNPRSLHSAHAYAVGVGGLGVKGLAAGQAAGGSLEWLAAARRSVPNIVSEPNGDGFEEPTVIDAVGRIHWQPNERSAWTLGTLLLDDRVRLNNGSTRAQANARYRDSYGWLTLEHRPGDAWSSTTTLSLTHWDRQRSGALAQSLVGSGNLTETRDYRSVAASSDWIYKPHDRQRWNFGVEAGYGEGESSYRRARIFNASVARSFGVGQSDVLVTEIAPRAARYAAFGAVRLNPGPRIEAEIGLRVDGQHYSAGSNARQWSPRVNIRYRRSPQLNLYTSWGVFTQAQRPDEWRLEEGQQQPDPAQRALHEIVGLTYTPQDGMSWRVEIYRKHWSSVSPYFDNLLSTQTLVPDLSADRVRIAPQSADALGVEISVRGALGTAYQYWGSYSWSRASDEVAGRTVLRSWDQPSAVSLGLSWTKRGFTVSGAMHQHSGWPRTPAVTVPAITTQDPLLTLGARNSTRWDNYLSVDLRLSWAREFRSSVFEVYADVTNAFDRANECCLALSLAGAGGPANIDTTFWRPRAANIGIEWRRPQ